MKKKLVLASSACLVASAMALGGCSGGSKPAETSAAAENLKQQPMQPLQQLKAVHLTQCTCHSTTQ